MECHCEDIYCPHCGDDYIVKKEKALEQLDNTVDELDMSPQEIKMFMEAGKQIIQQMRMELR